MCRLKKKKKIISCRTLIRINITTVSWQPALSSRSLKTNCWHYFFQEQTNGSCVAWIHKWLWIQMCYLLICGDWYLQSVNEGTHSHCSPIWVNFFSLFLWRFLFLFISLLFISAPLNYYNKLDTRRAFMWSSLFPPRPPSKSFTVLQLLSPTAPLLFVDWSHSLFLARTLVERQR